MSSRKIRRAAQHAARKAARKAGFPTVAVIAPEPAPIPETAAIPTKPAPVSDPKPISAARLAANRANAQLSTGPSKTGLAVSSQNRTIHGLARHNGAFKILPSEDALGFEALKQTLAEEHEPTTATEAILVDGMAESHWLAQRALHLQATCLDPETGAIQNEKHFSLYLRYQTTHTRAFHKCCNDLLKLRAERRKAEIGFEAQKHRIAAVRLNNQSQTLKNKLLRLNVLEKDPGYNADFARLGHAACQDGPEFNRLKAEFDAKYPLVEPEQEVLPAAA